MHLSRFAPGADERGQTNASSSYRDRAAVDKVPNCGPMASLPANTTVQAARAEVKKIENGSVQNAKYKVVDT